MKEKIFGTKTKEESESDLARATTDESKSAALIKEEVVADIHEDLDGKTSSTDFMLVAAVRYLLSLSGLAFSNGAIRDLPDTHNEVFDPACAVSALTNLGFDASFGQMDVADLREGHLPAIGFNRENEALVVEGIGGSDRISFRSFDLDGTSNVTEVDRLTANEVLTSFFVLARKRTTDVRTQRRNDWLWASLFDGKWIYAQVIIAAALTNFLGLSTSLFIMVVYDRVVPNEAIESLIALTLGIIIALAFDFIIKTLRAQFIDKASKRADARMSRLIFDKLLAMRNESSELKSGALASVVREFDTLREFFTSATLITIVDLPFIFFFIWVISLIAGPLSVVPLVAIPVVLLVGISIQPFLARIAEGALRSGMTKQSVLVETLNGLETIQATGSGRLMRRRFEEAASAQSETGLRSRLLANFAVNTAATVQQLAQVATIFYGVFLIQDGVITMGAMIAAVILSGRTLAPLSQLAAAMSRANSARQAYRALSQIMVPASQDNDRPNARLSRPILSGELELVDVSYSFPGSSAPIIKDLSIKIPAGQKVAVIGRMGSGKSTLARLMAGLLQPSSGAVLLDGVDVRQINESDVRRNVGVMLQESWLFSGTVKENLQMGFFEYDDGHLLRVAKVSTLDDFISSHPQGYDLLIREKGEGLSGGQRQSINLARAILHDPSLLILDEPTSSMDTATEKVIIDRLKNWSSGKTLIVVTHRNSLLALVDRVLVMDRGQVIADTTPEKLRGSGR